MKIIKYISLFLLVSFLGACAVTLTDKTANSFSIVATQGKYDNKVELSWIKIPYYHSYKVFRSDSVTGLYRSITPNTIESTIFNDTGIEAGKIYFYKVEAYNEIGIPSFTTESAEGFAGINAGLKPPNNVVANNGESSTLIKLEWDRVIGAATYRIEKRREDEFNFNIIAKVSYTQYEDHEVELGVNYYYRISSIDENNLYSPNSSGVGPVSLYGGNFAVFSSPGIYADKIVLTWTKIPNTKQYNIYRSENENSIGSKVTTIEPSIRTEVLHYEDRDVRPDTFYYYTIVYGNNTAEERSFSIKSFLYSDHLPQKVDDLIVGQGIDEQGVNLSWSAVAGDNITYEVSRSVSEMGPWIALSTNTATSYRDTDILRDQYSSFYKIITLKQNGSEYTPSPDSDILEGWVNRAPINIKASNIFRDRVILFWDPVPNAESYQISYSLTEDGDYILLDPINANYTDKVTYEHEYNLGDRTTLDLFYKIKVTLVSSVTSSFSVPVQGQLNDIGTPKNIKLVNNKNLTKNIGISWDAVPNVSGYAIYIATLDHRNSQFDQLTDSDYKKVGESQNPAYTIAFGGGNNPPLYPIRRHGVMIKALDSDKSEGAGTTFGDTVYRLPLDALDFAKDVDFTIIQAQTQIANFGNMGSGATINGRLSGNYENSAGFSAENIWRRYISFEVILDGAPNVSVDISDFTGVMTGSMTISGLYSGEIEYLSLKASNGGYVTAGGIKAIYKNSNGGTIGSITLTLPRDVNILESTYLDAATKPSYPSYVTGGG